MFPVWRWYGVSATAIQPRSTTRHTQDVLAMKVEVPPLAL